MVRKPEAECRVQLLIAAGSRSSVHCSDLMSTVAICGMWSGDPALCSSGSTSKYYNFGLHAFKLNYYCGFGLITYLRGGDIYSRSHRFFLVGRIDDGWQNNDVEKKERVERSQSQNWRTLILEVVHHGSPVTVYLMPQSRVWLCNQSGSRNGLLDKVGIITSQVHLEHLSFMSTVK